MRIPHNGNRLHRLLVATAVFSGLCAGTVSAGSITGTKHDFSTSIGQDQGNEHQQICIFCHVPHNANTSVSNVPLWGRDLSGASYQLYQSATFEGAGTIGQPAGTSKLCLSCHDGTLAVDSYGGNQGSYFLSGNSAIGAEPEGLSDDHPISFVYDGALADLDGSLFDPDSVTITIGTDKTKEGTITDVLLFDNRMECASCHDVHNTFTESPPLLKVSRVRSELCLTCHNK